jgi:hypothetical protein
VNGKGSFVEPVLLSFGVIGVSISSCIDLPLLYDTLVQLLFDSGWDGTILAWV